MTAILCYGDSNTWGRELGDDVHMIEEGQNGRTTLAEVVLSSDAGPEGGAPLVVLVVIPPPFAALGEWDLNESPDAGRESERLSQAFRDAAAAYAEDGVNIPLLDLRDHVTSTSVDGIHLEADGHRAIGLAIAVRLRELLGL